MEAESVALQERIAERFARTDSARARRWLAFLAEASDVLAESLDYETTLSSVATLVVPELADWCTVEILEEGILWPVLVRHSDPEKMALAVALRQRYPVRETPDSPLWTALRTGRAVLKQLLSARQVEGWAEGAASRETASALDVKSAMYVPLKARGRVLGVLSFVTAESRSEYDESDLAMAEELAGRCALALDNALLHSQLKQALAQKEEAIQERERLLQALELERHRLETVVRQMPAGVMLVEATSGRVLLANARAEWLFGHPLSTEGFPAASQYQGFRPDGTSYAPEEWPLARSVLTGEVVTGEELIFERVDQMRLRLLVSSLPLRDADGRVVAGIGTFENITGVRAAEEDALRHARFMEQFIGILGHDLRNPLQAIRGSAQQLLRRQLAGPEQKSVSRIAGAADRMGRMITDLLDFTRSRLGGGIPLTPSEVCLGALARMIIDELEAAHPGQRIELEVDDSASCQLDRDRMAQVIQNLVGNALQYGSREAPVRVAVRAGAGGAVLTVHNRGDSIPAERLAELFEPFRRGKGAPEAKRPADGLGLGLYITQQIVLAHGGTVEVASLPEDGTTFTVRLPRAPSEPGPRAQE